MYPTMKQVEEADRTTICRWYRFLSSPGMSAINNPNREVAKKTMMQEKEIMDKICERLKEFGGFTPAISKQLGW